ncbi:MAG: DMT family transporter [Bacteroidales bacterium]|nr:DMT family transporter [Bacteroidales bacterium]MCF8389382.1 DMT family transporter [Bacteroidales bacterium]
MFGKIKKYLSSHQVTKGYIFAFLATLGMANVYIFSKAALSEIHLYQFGFYWFGLAFIWSLFYVIFSGKLTLIKSLNTKSRYLLILVGFLELFAAITLFISIEIVENPTIVSFLSNLTPVFVAILGISFLAERFTKIEVTGILFTLIGAILISYSGKNDLNDIFIEGTGYILLSSLFMSISVIVSKYRIKEIDPSLLMINRIAYLFIFFTIMMIQSGKSLEIPGAALFNVGMGSVLGPFLTGLAQFSSLKYIEATRTMIIQSTRGIFVAVGAIIYLGVFPVKMQIIGGIITIIGISILATGKIIISKYQKKDRRRN